MILSFIQQFHDVIRLAHLLGFKSAVLITLASDAHVHCFMAPKWLPQLRNQTRIHSKKKNGVSKFLAPTSLFYKRMSPSQLLLVSHRAEPGHMPPTCKRRLSIWVESKWEWSYQDWLSAGAGHTALLDQRGVLLARVKGAGGWSGYWVGSWECLHTRKLKMCRICSSLFRGFTAYGLKAQTLEKVC